MHGEAVLPWVRFQVLKLWELVRNAESYWILPSKLPLKKLYTMAFVLNMGHLPVRSLELICRNLVLRFHLRLAYAVSKLLLRKFLVAALNQTRNQLGAALKTGTFRVAVHRLRPSIDLAGFSGVYLCFGRLGQPNSSRDNKALSFWASVSVLRLLAVL